MFRRLSPTYVLICGLLCSGVPASAQTPASGYSIVDIGTDGRPRAVNENGMVVGTNGVLHAFVWTQATGMIDLGTLGGAQSHALAVNNSGMVVGISQTGSTALGEHAFVWTEATGMIDLGTLGGGESRATAVNDNGMVVGSSLTAAGEVHAFAWTQATGMLDLGTLGGRQSAATAVNDNGMVVGSTVTAGGDGRAFAWTQATGMLDLGGFSSAAYAVNDNGMVVGVFQVAYPDDDYFPWRYHLFTWTQSTGIQDRGVCSAGLCRPIAVNTSGMVTGIAQTLAHNDPDTVDRGFAWTEATGMIDLGTLGGGFYDVTEPRGLTDSGMVVGISTTPFVRAFAWTIGTGMIDLGTLGGPASEANAVSNNGIIAGNAWVTGDGSSHLALWLPPTPVATPVGFGVAVQPQAILTDGSTAPVSISFDTVTSAGETTVTTSPTGTPAPGGFTLGQPVIYYDLVTTAQFSAATVCFSWLEGQFDNETTVRLLHGENGAWADVTSSVDMQANVICGQVTSFSPFAIAQIARYQFSGFEAPLLADGSASIKQSKQGRTIPIKFQLRSLGRAVGTATATIAVYRLLNTATGSVDMTELTADAGAANDGGNSFRYDPSTGNYVYNLSTAGFASPATYRILVTIDDGGVYTVDFSLR